MRIRPLLVLALLVGLAPPARSQVPSTMSYQGLLTDAGGTPVPDGAYSLAFTLYKVPSGGAVVWTETQPAVTVSAGGFAVILGSVTPLTAVPFDRTYWLGISVNGAAELVPRIQLAASPYALALRTPFTATTNDTTPLLRLVNTGGGTALRVEGFVTAGGSGDGGVWVGNPVGTQLPAAGMVQHPGGVAGAAYVWGDGPSKFAVVNGSNGGNGDPFLYMTGSASDFLLDTNKTGDAAVELPANSVGPAEMSGVPGLTFARDNTVGVVPTYSYMVATTIITPTDGYVHVTASGGVTFSGTTGPNTVAYQIDTSPTPVENPAYSRAVGAHQFVSTVYHFSSAYAERVFYLPAGEHTFYLVARHDGGGSANFLSPTITAVFLPTAYGAIFSSVTPGEESSFEHVETVQGGPAIPGRPTAAVRAVDLRELELRAARARAEAARAERDLARAQADREMAELRERFATGGRAAQAPAEAR